VFGADVVWPLWDPTVAGEFFVLADPGASTEDMVIRAVARPVCFGFVPQRANGGAVLVCAGGGYTQLVIGKEGVEIARWLSGLGYHAFVLAHRFPNAEFGAQAPVDDAREAMRLIRARGAEMGIAHVGALGLSSGGHLAASLAATYPDAWRAPVSAHATFASRPDFLIVGYAPISTNAAGRTVVAGKAPLAPPQKQELYDAVQPDVQLMSGPPPAFIFYSGSDPVVPVENGRRLQAVFEARGAPAELHVFADAPHGFALRTPEIPAGRWPLLCEAWLRRIGDLPV
jgi:acetyl esterase/lipase